MARKAGLRRTFNAQAGKCFYCAIDMSLNDYSGLHAPTRDHLLPKSKGGKLDEYNTVCACWKCNQEKGDMPAAVFMGILRRRLDRA